MFLKNHIKKLKFLFLFFFTACSACSQSFTAYFSPSITKVNVFEFIQENYTSFPYPFLINTSPLNRPFFGRSLGFSITLDINKKLSTGIYCEQNLAGTQGSGFSYNQNNIIPQQPYSSSYGGIKTVYRQESIGAGILFKLKLKEYEWGVFDIGWNSGIDILKGVILSDFEIDRSTGILNNGSIHTMIGQVSPHPFKKTFFQVGDRFINKQYRIGLGFHFGISVPIVNRLYLLGQPGISFYTSMLTSEKGNPAILPNGTMHILSLKLGISFDFK